MQEHEKAICICGSGKHYVNCCLPAHIARSRANPAREFNEEIRRLIGARHFDSIDALNEFSRLYCDRYNRAPQEDLLGLSPDQVHWLVDYPLEGTQDMLRLDSSLGRDVLADIPVVRDAECLLKTLAEAGPVKMTATGNLPRDLAKRLFDEIDRSRWKKYIKFRSETDSMPLHSLRLILSMGGWIRKLKGRLQLTKRGHKVGEQGFTGADYADLFWAFTRRFNWKYQDRFPDFDIIQKSYLFSLYLLHKHARAFVADYQMAPHFVRAFPAVLAETATIEKEAYAAFSHCYRVRFLDRFCAYFGLIEMKPRGPDPFDSRFDLRISRFYDKLLTWKI
jgi:hypothetical protein